MFTFSEVLTFSQFLQNVTSIIKNLFDIMKPGSNYTYNNSQAQHVEIDGKVYRICTNCCSFHVARELGHPSVFDNKSPIVFIYEKIARKPIYNRLLQNNRLNLQILDKNTKALDIITKYASDSLIVISSDSDWNKTTLNIYFLNLVPSHEDVCYQFSLSIIGNNHTSFIDNQFYYVIKQALDYSTNVFANLREEVWISTDRLVLELQILKNMGYDATLREFEDEYALELPLASVSSSVVKYMQAKPDSVIIGLSKRYPIEKPTIILKRNATYKALDVDWCVNYTIGHIIRGLSEGE